MSFCLFICLICIDFVAFGLVTKLYTHSNMVSPYCNLPTLNEENIFLRVLLSTSLYKVVSLSLLRAISDSSIIFLSTIKHKFHSFCFPFFLLYAQLFLLLHFSFYLKSISNKFSLFFFIWECLDFPFAVEGYFLWV